jgi:hypothetical protein
LPLTSAGRRQTIYHENEEGQTTKAYETGYPIGHMVRPSEETPAVSGPAKIVLFNHLRFTVLYNEDRGKQKVRIVGFEVEPYSVHHSYVNQVDFSQCHNQISGDHAQCALQTCSKTHPVGVRERPMLLDPSKKGSTEVDPKPERPTIRRGPLLNLPG